MADANHGLTTHGAFVSLWSHLIAGRVVGDILWPRKSGVGHNQPVHARAQRDCCDVGLVCLGQIWSHLPRVLTAQQNARKEYTTRTSIHCCRLYLLTRSNRTAKIHLDPACLQPFQAA